MSTKPQWSVVRVEKYKGKNVFRHGHYRLRTVPADFLGRDSRVKVFRAGKLFDEGDVKEMGGHDGSQRFSGLDKIVPQKAKWYKTSFMSTGVTDPLLPVWFEQDDTIRIQVASATFRANMRAWPEYWKQL